ncbi:hypothetical protein MTR67_044113 [Solanum verrucosum]|uniref:Uncharacterized protein n=1 Tax=Solanum verrucosum TaxID=315347 RepID=A0AAF0USR6_SOLVR|nr:hypothetical protein MTR67_044113 [Solanum verrucosum]
MMNIREIVLDGSTVKKFRRDDVYYDDDPNGGTDIIEVTCDNGRKKEKKARVSKSMGKDCNIRKSSDQLLQENLFMNKLTMIIDEVHS